jgi:hypothetical protein
MPLIELNGPGEAVFNQLNDLRTQTAQMAASASGDIDLRNVFTAMRSFLYKRADSIGCQGYAREWRMSGNNKPPLLSGFKDSFELNRHVLNSLPLLEEMRHIVIDGGSIGAMSGHKDDRVIAAALAHEAWRRWVQQKLRNMGLTFERAYMESIGAGPNQAQKMAINYLKTQNITVDEGLK